MIVINQAVEVKYAGQTVRGWAVSVTVSTVTIETSFGVRAFPSAQVQGLSFMR